MGSSRRATVVAGSQRPNPTRHRAGILHSPFCMFAGENIPARFVVPTVASSVDLVVHLGIDQHGVRCVNEIVGVPGRVENDIIETEPIFERGGGDLCRVNGMPPRRELYERVGIDIHRLLSEAV